MTSQKNSFDHIWFPFSYYEDMCRNRPITVERGEGMYLYDTDGKQYMDAVGSWWVSILGHCHPEISEAIHQQLNKLEHVIMAGFISPVTAELSELLAAFLPHGLSKIFYSDDGSTAVEAALKMAIQYWALKGEHRNRFIAFGGAYHGDTLGAMSVGCISQYHTLFHERFSQQFFTDPPYCYRCPVGCEPESCSAQCMDSMEQILREHGEHIAACIVEPMVQGAGGMRIYPAKVLRRVSQLCDRYGILLIDDEVAMGFGRTGKMFACEHAQVVPDIMCVAKGLTAGYLPLAATVVKEEIFREFCGAFPTDRIFHHGHSFTGNPLAAAAACATMKIIRRDNLPASLSDTMEYFQKSLTRLDEIEQVGDIRSIGMVGAFELVSNRETKQKLPADRRIAYKISQRAIQRGLLVRPLGDTLYYMPAFIIGKDQIDFMIDTTMQVLREVLDEEAAYI